CAKRRMGYLRQLRQVLRGRPRPSRRAARRGPYPAGSYGRLVCARAVRLNVCPAQLEAEGPSVIATLIDILVPSIPDEDDVDVLWPEEAGGECRRRYETLRFSR